MGNAEYMGMSCAHWFFAPLHHHYYHHHHHHYLIALTVKETRRSLEKHGKRIVIPADVDQMEGQLVLRDSALNKKTPTQKVEKFVKTLHVLTLFDVGWALYAPLRE